MTARVQKMRSVVLIIMLTIIALILGTSAIVLSHKIYRDWMLNPECVVNEFPQCIKEANDDWKKHRLVSSLIVNSLDERDKNVHAYIAIDREQNFTGGYEDLRLGLGHIFTRDDNLPYKEISET